MKKPAPVLPIQPVLTGLTNDIRAQLVAETGQDIAADDPAMVLATLVQIMLPKVAAQVAATFTEANQAAAAALAEMRSATAKAAAQDLMLLASQTREALRLDLAQADTRATAIIRRIEAPLSIKRWTWLLIGLAIAGVFGLGMTLGIYLK